MYPLVLSIHNILRWVVLIVLILAFVNALLGWIQKRSWNSMDRKLGTFAGIGVDIQLLLGLLLYLVFSPITTSSFADFGAAMASTDRRFFLVEHSSLMLLAVIFVHLGSILARKATDDQKKHRQAAIWFGLTLLVVLFGTPWFRPLFPGL
jgi:hypothetical protein